MRFIGLALVTSAVVLSACGGGDNKQATPDTATKAPATPAMAPGTPAAGAVAAAPITGKTWDISMVQDDKGYHFEPSTLTIKVGDGVKFTVKSGTTHNITFDAPTAPAASAQLDANMPNTPPKMNPLSSGMLMNAGDSYTVSFANVPAGVYPFHCIPHQPYGMTGTITVQ
jgi:plastocyanin